MEEIRLFKGDDTDFNDSLFLTIKLNTDLDLTGFIGEFRIHSYVVTADVSNKEMAVHIPAKESAKMPVGDTKATLRITDTQGRVKTVSNAIPFYVTQEVGCEQVGEINLPVSECEPISMSVSVGDTLAVDYDNLKNLPTFNGTEIKGKLTYQALNITPLNSFDNLVKVVNEKASTQDVQNALDKVEETKNTLSNDLEELGNQVQTIESKLPAVRFVTESQLPSANETNKGLFYFVTDKESLMFSTGSKFVDLTNVSIGTSTGNGTDTPSENKDIPSDTPSSEEPQVKASYAWGYDAGGGLESSNRIYSLARPYSKKNTSYDTGIALYSDVYCTIPVQGYGDFKAYYSDGQLIAHDELYNRWVIELDKSYQA